MDRKKFTYYRVAITGAVGILVGLSILRYELTIALGAAVVIGMLLLFSFKSRVKQIIEDERVYKISELASRRTIQVVGVTTAILGLSLLGLSKGGYLDMSDVGYSLAYFAAVLVIVYMLFYGYYNRKLGA
jgi:uncharacterized membrane protein